MNNFSVNEVNQGMCVASIFSGGGTLFENFQKNLLRKLKKCIIIADEILRKISTKFLRKLRKCIILAYFSKNLTNHALIFCAFRRKTQSVGKF